MLFALLLAAAEPQMPELGTSATVDEWCSVVGATARSIMKIRQLEAPLSEALKSADKGGSVAPLFRTITFDAYEQQAFFTEENRQLAIREFGNRWEVTCHQVYAKREANPLHTHRNSGN